MADSKLDIEIDRKDIHKRVTVYVHIKESKWYDIRLNIALNLIEFGAFIAGFNFEVYIDG